MMVYNKRKYDLLKGEQMKAIGILNQKGGVGKSTTALSLGAGLTRKGFKVLYVDMDAQCNLSNSMGAAIIAELNIFDVLTGRTDIEHAITQTSQGLIIPGSPALSGADMVIADTGKEYRLKEALGPLSRQYDYVIIDTPPALGILTINALTAAAGCIIPSQADVFSLQGITQLFATIQAVKKYCNPELSVMGILITRYNQRLVISRDVADMLRETAAQMGTKLYATRIRECAAIKESQAVKRNIFEYAPRSNAAADYAAFVDELLDTIVSDTIVSNCSEVEYGK